MLVELRVTGGPARGKHLNVDDELLIGRAVDDAAGRLDGDSELSRRHARLVRETGGGLTLEDLGSMNGTFVNGGRLEARRALLPGDTIKVGATTLEVVAPPSPTAPSAQPPKASSGTTRTLSLPFRRSATPRRPVVRFATSVMVMSGALLLGDAAATLAWQEPVSYVSSVFRQQALESSLDDAPARVRARNPLKGDAIGRIELPTLGQKYFVVEGTDNGDLRKGPGHYADTPLPGGGGTVGIAGHRTTHGAPFRKIDQLTRGDEVIVGMTYGTFTYKVEKTRIVYPSDVFVKAPVGHEQLILSACHPLYSAAQRIVVFARLVARRPARVG